MFTSASIPANRCSLQHSMQPYCMAGIKTQTRRYTHIERGGERDIHIDRGTQRERERERERKREKERERVREKEKKERVRERGERERREKKEVNVNRLISFTGLGKRV